MISFDKLPDELPKSQFAVIPEGKYKAIIEKAEMRQPKDVSKPPYLSLMWKVFNEDGSDAGTLFDMLTESDSQYMLYKIKVFMEALDINLGSTFELADLAKVCPKAMARIAIKVNKDGNGNDQSQINMFDANMYEKLTQEESFLNVPEGESGLPFDEVDSNY